MVAANPFFSSRNFNLISWSVEPLIKCHGGLVVGRGENGSLLQESFPDFNNFN